MSHNKFSYYASEAAGALNCDVADIEAIWESQQCLYGVKYDCLTSEHHAFSVHMLPFKNALNEHENCGTEFGKAINKAVEFMTEDA